MAGKEVLTLYPNTPSVGQGRAAVPQAGDVYKFTAGVEHSTVISPAQITADQNDYAPTGIATAYAVRVDTNADGVKITGVSASQTEGRVLLIENDGSTTLVLPHEDTNSTAANRFSLQNGLDAIIPPGSIAVLKYDGTASRWRIKSAAIGSSGTFTPTIFGATTAGTPTYVTQTGYYSINGDVLNFMCEVRLSAKGGMSGAIRMGGLPITSRVDVISYASAVLVWTGVNITASESVIGGVYGGDQYVGFFVWDSTTTPTNLLDTEITDNYRVLVSGSYLI